MLVMAFVGEFPVADDEHAVDVSVRPRDDIGIERIEHLRVEPDGARFRDRPSLRGPRLVRVC
jgi:hypothetical protein